MNSYERFAEVYDELMTDIPYAQYVEWIKRFAPPTQYKQLLDIGCGTGILAFMLHEANYEVTGIDLSEDMLAIASARMNAHGISMPLYAMSMDELQGFDNVDIAIIPIDSINYVKEQANVIETFKRIYDSLRDGGQLFFDVHSIFKMDDIFLDGPFTYDDGEITYVWHTEPGEFEHSVYHQMTFFVQTEGDLFERFDEEHFQRTFAVAQYEAWLKEIGFTSVEISADWSDEAPHEESERIFIRAIK